MSTTATGPLLDLDGPLPVAPEYGLLSIPGVDQGDRGDAPDTGAGADDDSRWEGGAYVYGYPILTPSLIEPCATGTSAVKDSGDADDEQPPIPKFDPVGIYLPIHCSTLGMSNANLEVLQQRAVKVLEATLSWAFERILSQSLPISNNAFLADSSLDIMAGGAAVSPRIGLSYLANAIGTTARGGIIHATPAIGEAWGFHQLKTDGETAYTASGIPVALGGGYIGADPANGASPTFDPDLDGGTTAGTKEWAFATGPVEVRRTSIRPNDLRAVEQTDNTVTFRPELTGLVEWDTELQVGVLIDWSLA